MVLKPHLVLGLGLVLDLGLGLVLCLGPGLVPGLVLGLVLVLALVTEGQRRPAITSTSGGAPPRAVRSHPAGMERARIQEEPRWGTRAFDGGGVL